MCLKVGSDGLVRDKGEKVRRKSPNTFSRLITQLVLGYLSF